MRASQYHINTLKEAPAEAEVVSHQLMTRAGMIRKQAGGVYTYMPLGYRVLRKIQNIVREEQERAGAVEILMPFVQPADLWMETARWQKYGAELLRIKDRHDRDFVLQPTSEEVVTDIARAELKSWRQLPITLFHIQTKFRDERRPRFGLMRSREFIMKDAYSFDRDEAGAQLSYDKMYDAYVRTFERMRLKFRPIAADTGSIGGSRSHEFQVIADAGEDLIVYDPNRDDFAANIELAPAPCLLAERAAPTQARAKAHTPNMPKCEMVSEHLKLPITQMVKAVCYALESDAATDAKGADAQAASAQPALFLFLVRADHEVNEVKVGKLPGVNGTLRLANEAEIKVAFGTEPGFIGPCQPVGPVTIVADLTVAKMSDFVCGANEKDHHFHGVNWGRDLPEPDLVADIRNVVEGDSTPDGKGQYAIQHGIEVGHVFYLGTLYSGKMGATFLNEQGKATPLEMGCYGIGISRVAAAAIEQNHDDKGMVWPLPIAPFEVVICPIGYDRSEAVKAKAEALYDELRALGMDVILDDRDIRPGVMFADWELIGVPIRVTLGDRGLKAGTAELTRRDGNSTEDVPVDELLTRIQTLYEVLA